MHKSQEKKLQEDIGVRMKEIRKLSRSKRQEDFSKQVGIGQPQVSRIEKGQNALSPAVLLQLMRVRIDNKRINMDWLITGRGEKLLSDALDDEDVHDMIYKKISKLDLKKKKALLEVIG